jgi:hypothetical protein
MQLGGLYVFVLLVALHTHYNGLLFLFSAEEMQEGDVQDIATSIGSLLAFLLGLCVGQALNRWWTIRDSCVGGLWGAIDDLVRRRCSAILKLGRV